MLDVSGSLEMSCNVAFMKMGEALGVKNTLQFEQIFNIGFLTNMFCVELLDILLADRLDVGVDRAHERAPVHRCYGLAL